MTSDDDSDDEPLSVLAELKKNSGLEILPVYSNRAPRSKTKNVKKPCDVTIALQSLDKEEAAPPVVERPADVWLYLKDMNSTGPFSCLLCSDWFITKTRMVIHYVIRHKKDYCGICRYFVLNRDIWWEHVKFHAPWSCSQCDKSFPTQNELREHFSSIHKLIHCRLCHLRVSDDEQYDKHLFQKHNVTNVSNKNKEVFWEIEFENSQKFLCLLCSKSNTVTRCFSDHYMAHHHFTLKCFTTLISGTTLPFHTKGVDLTPEFIETQLKTCGHYGYIDLDQKPIDISKDKERDEMSSLTVDCEPTIKDETMSDDDDNPAEADADTSNNSTENNEGDKKVIEAVKAYKGFEDFDVTLMELIMIKKYYCDYVNVILNEINSNVMPLLSNIKYEDVNTDILLSIDCGLCQVTYSTVNTFVSHMSKMHSVKMVPTFSCRVCATVFDSFSELESHFSQEMGDFEDLWLCQFCDEEFKNRDETRKHLTKHWNIVEYDNCFSPHLGFKCKFCPTLFWNETDRETHQVRVHYQKHKSDFYTCEKCSEIFGDKVWFIHHYQEKHNSEQRQYVVKCCICSIVLPTIDEMRTHFGDKHPEARKMFCSLDDCRCKPFCHKKSFQLHLKAIHNPALRSPRASNCNVCGQHFDSTRACSAHTAQAHGPGRYRCTLCGEMLRTSDERKIHYLIRHPGRYQYQCDVCDKSFQYKSSLYLHKQNHMPIKQDYTCDYCRKVFKKRDSYREHILIHEAPRHACSYCPMRFVQRSNMLRHERRHTGEKPYECPHPQCSRTFADKGACTSHSRTHQIVPSFSCMYCGQTFAQKSKLTYHLRRHTGENLESCPICSKLFTSAGSLRDHIKRHEKSKKTVKCPLCKKMYVDNRDLMRHMRAVHTHAEFKCPICPKSVASAASLRDHVFTHSKVKILQCLICNRSYNVRRTMFRHLRRRHGVKDNYSKLTDYYRQRNAEECNLGLDKETMASIFGPSRRKKTTDLIFQNYFTVNNEINTASAKETDSESNDDENDSIQAEVTESTKMIQIKIEPHNIEENDKGEVDDEEIIARPDFVNVKVECVDENEKVDELCEA